MLKTEKAWYIWKTVAGYVYILVCLFDFVVMPMVVHASSVDSREIITEIMYEIEDRGFALGAADKLQTKRWEPVTLVGAGVFHLSFGAILTGATLSKNKESTESNKQV